MRDGALSGARRGGLAGRLWRSTALRLALLAFVVYNANLRSITSADTFPTRYLPISIVREHDLDLDEFPFLRAARPGVARADGDSASTPYYLQRARGHYMSTYPVLPAVLAAPVYAVPVLMGLTDGPGAALGYSRTEIVGTLLSKVAASLAVALSVAAVYLTLLRATTARGAWWGALVYAFGTSSWSVSSQGLWQTAMSQPLIALALYWLVRGRDDERYTVWAGLPLAMAVACRPPTVIVAAVMAAYVLRHAPRLFVRFAVAPAAVAALLVGYNEYYFGTLTGGYRAMLGGTLQLPRWQGLPGLLVSPSRGILACSPVLVYGAAGAVAARRRGVDPLFRHAALATLLTTLFYALFSDWFADFSYSYRFLVDVLPMLALLATVTWGWVTARRARVAAFGALAALSVGVQVVGAFFYPCGWFDAGAPARMWDVTRPEALVCLRAGPVVPDGVRYLRAVAARR